MKKMVLIVSLLTLVAFVAVAMAQQNPAPAKPATTMAPAATPAPAPTPAPKAAKMEKFSGTIENVDEMGKAITLKGKKDTMTFTMGDKTKITKAGKDMPFVELKKDMDVAVEYMKEGDKMIAGSIKVAAPKAAPKAAPAKAATTEAPAPKK
jgi:hypothetical protein